ncbi:uridine diphosphate-N-acetylglucosamine-binding protein YvcK [Streptomyces sp. NPDC048018]|uniref:gluconeogenesis factor YvcK family protein n=1 Tax=Streptomyces sp. NPDC048018 TaxID=3365499 RepID=UPI00371A2C84
MHGRQAPLRRHRREAGRPPGLGGRRDRRRAPGHGARVKPYRRRTSTLSVRRTLRRRGAQPKVVALGGGMGLSASLAALRRITGDLTAVVTVADDGGSSGRLREELGVLPPGDLRKALAALCGDDDWGQTWARVIQHRFQSKGEMHGHAVGNLLIVALWEQLGGDPVQALDLVGKLLGAHGRVLPMSAVPLELQALVKGHDPARPHDVDTVRGQATVALTPGEVQSVHLVPHDPPAVPEAVAAVLDADWVVLGPGSWFSSVIPHLLVPELLDALVETKARRVLSLNLAPQPGETEGFSPQRHLEVLARHAPKLALDVVLADEAAVRDVSAREPLTDAAKRLGAEVELAPVARPDGAPKHDPELLAAAYDRIFRMHGRIGPWR